MCFKRVHHGNPVGIREAPPKIENIRHRKTAVNKAPLPQKTGEGGAFTVW